MPRFAWVKALFAAARPARKPRLAAEALEDRLTPALSVVSASPAPEWTAAPLTTLDLTFNNSLDPSTVQAFDLNLLRNGSTFGSVAAAQLVPGTNDRTIRFTLSGVTTPGPLETYIRAGSVRTLNGEPNDSYDANYTLTAIGFSPVQPPGSLIYTGSRTGGTHTFAVDAGQTITLVASAPAAGTSPLSVALRGPAVGTNPGPLLGSVTAPSLGLPAVLQSVVAPATGLYTATVSGGPASFGPTLQVFLNADRELEGTGPGLTNNTPATAQSLSFGPLAPGAGAPDRAGVTGLFSGSPDHYAVPLQAGQSVGAALGRVNPNTQLFGTAVGVQSVGAAPTDVTVGDLDGNGVPDLVFALGNPGSATGGLGVQYGGTVNGSVSYFAGATAGTGGGNPRAVRLGDLNGDGKLDAVVANGANNTVGVFFGTGADPFAGDGPPPAFDPVVLYDGGPVPHDLALTDLNGDGKLDIVVGNAYGNAVRVLLNAGDGTFGPTATVSLGGLTFIVNGVAVGDVTGDGKPDIVAVTVDNANLAVLPGDGTGTFAGPAVVDPTGGGNPQDVVLGDFNEDGLLDAAVGHASGNLVTVFLNQNNPADPFGPWTVAAGPTSPGVNKLAVADFNLDGHADLVATPAFTSNPVARVWFGDGLGQFDRRLDFPISGPVGTPAAASPDGVAAVDANGDGAPDIVTANTGSNNLSVLANGLSELRIDLVDANGTVVAAGAPAANAASAIGRFVAPAGGTYYLRVTGVGRSEYAAVVTRGAAVEVERNDTPAAAQPLDGTAGVLGSLSSSPRLFTAVPGVPGQIRELAPDGTVVRSFPAPNNQTFSDSSPVGLAFDGKSLFFVNWFTNHTLYELDPDTGAVRDSDTIPVAFNGVDGLAAVGGKVYVADGAGNYLQAFDPVTDTFSPFLTISTINPGAGDLFGGIAGITGPNRLVAATNTPQGTVRVVEIDPATGVITASFATPITNFGVRGLAVVDGLIYLGRTGAQADVYTRAGEYVRTVSMSGQTTALGGDDTGLSAEDWYSVEVGFEQVIELRTRTPADGPGGFDNALDPHIELFDPAGNPVAAGEAGPDGRNETIGYTGFSSGTYRVRVTGENNSAGEYVLSVAYSQAPRALDDAAATDEDTAVTINLLGNDSDADGDTLFVAAVTQPAHGTAVLNADGTVTYTPAADYNGNDEFTYTASDGRGGVATATVYVSVNPVNDAPVARDDAYATDEDVTLDIAAPGVFANDSDPDAGDRFAVVEYTSPAHGGLGLHQDGRLVYFPDRDYNGPDSFTYTVYDAQGAASNVATVRITVNPVNDPPFAGDLGTSVFEDGALTVDIQEITSDAEGDPRAVTDLSAPAHGTAVLNADGTVTYTPAANYNGPDSFTYTVTDGNGGSDTGTISVDVTPVNDTPAALPDAYATDEDAALVVDAAHGVLANDTDVENDPLTAVHIAGPYHGDLTLNADGSFTYTPDPDYNGADEFTYSAHDGPNSGTVPVTVTLTVRPVNDAPTAAAASLAVDEDGVVTVDLRTLAADLETADADLTFAVGGAANGTATLDGDGHTARFAPAANFNGAASFTYTVTDTGDGTSPARSAGNTVSVAVAPVNDVPVAAAGAAATNEDVFVDIDLRPLVVDVETADADLTFDVGGAGNGTVELLGDGYTARFAPAANFNGAASFTYTVTDTGDGTSPARSAGNTVSVTVAPVNDTPVAAADAAATDEDTAVAVAVRSNDTDVDGDALAVTAVTQGANGAVVINADGTVTYTPAADFNGTDSFTYTVSDGTASATATVTVTVRPVNDAPVAVADAYTVDEIRLPLTVSAPGVLGNDTDVDGDPLSAAVVSGPANGTLALNADGSFTYQAAPGFAGTDSFTYRVSDGAGGSATATVSITVRNVVDVDPADAANVIDLKADSKIAVAILSTAGFDAQTVDVASLRFGRTGTEDSLVRQKKTGRPQYSVQDVNGDGRLDLVVYFQTSLTGLAVGDTTARLTGRLTDGYLFDVTEAVTVVSSTRGNGNGKGNGR